MALIRCSECGGKISDSALTCPHCGKAVDVDECKVNGVGKKLRRTENVKTIIIVLAIVAVIVIFVIPKVFLRGLLNWEDHFTVKTKESFVSEKMWEIEAINGKRYEDVKIHFVHYSETHGNIKFVVEKKTLYGDTAIFERDIKEKIDKALKQEGASDEEIIDEEHTKIEFITWDSIKK